MGLLNLKKLQIWQDAVPIPQEIDSVFSISSAGTIMLYTIDPDLLVGVNYEFNEDEKEYIIDEVKDLPAYGQGARSIKKLLLQQHRIFASVMVRFRNRKSTMSIHCRNRQGSLFCSLTGH